MPLIDYDTKCLECGRPFSFTEEEDDPILDDSDLFCEVCRNYDPDAGDEHPLWCQFCSNWEEHCNCYYCEDCGMNEHECGCDDSLELSLLEEYGYTNLLLADRG